MVKRSFDISLSLIGLIISLPFFLLIGIMILSGSKGGVFYKQQRVGRYQKNFFLYKFRTMSVGSDKEGMITIGNRDPRVTNIGYILRKYKLDEFPQLLNVLKGDMSIVGPRPEVEEYVEMYSSQQLEVLSIRPGITDYASIEFSNENELLGQADDPYKMYVEEIMPKKLALNLKYIEEMSFFTDIKIIVKTILKIFT